MAHLQHCRTNNRELETAIEMHFIASMMHGLSVDVHEPDDEKVGTKRHGWVTPEGNMQSHNQKSAKARPNDLRRLALMSACSMALMGAPQLWSQSAWAQNAQTPATDQAAGQNADDDAVEDVIVVVGTPGGSGIRKQDASFAITTLSADAIEEISPKSTADLLKVVPGVWAESSGGESGANIFVRGFPSGGDADFVTISLEGSPIFPPPTLSFLENSTLFRVDETVKRVEGLRGGPASVFSNGQPGLTVNFAQKTGGPEFDGLVKVGGTTFGERRVDTVFSGPINENTFFSIGGFYRASHGIRDTQFTSERGGQISANLVREFEHGSVLIYGRYVDDQNQWILPIPLQQDANGRLSEFPGFDAGTGTLQGNETRIGVLEIGPNNTFLRRDLADGRGPKIGTIGANINYDIGVGITFRDRFGFTSGRADTVGLVPVAAPVSARAFLANTARFGAGATGNFTFVNGGGALTDLNTPVIEAGFWSVRKDIQSFTNDASFAKEVFAGNNATAGVYFASVSTSDLWYLGNNQLLVAEPNARRLNLTLNDGRTATRDGFSGAPFFALNATYSNTSVAFYLSDEWKVNDQLRLDAGFRVENYNVNGTIENADFGVDLDNNPNTLYNNSASVLNGSTRNVVFDRTVLSWTGGANYAFTPKFGIYGRISNGTRFPQFDNLRDGVTNLQEVRQYEAGVKANNDRFTLTGTFFYDRFTGLPFQRFLGSGPSITEIGNSRSYGFEWETSAKIYAGLGLDFTGTYLNAVYQNFLAGGVDLRGNRVQRQPRFQARFTPNYKQTFD